MHKIDPSMDFKSLQVNNDRRKSCFVADSEITNI